LLELLNKKLGGYVMYYSFSNTDGDVIAYSTKKAIIDDLKKELAGWLFDWDMAIVDIGILKKLMKKPPETALEKVLELGSSFDSPYFYQSNRSGSFSVFDEDAYEEYDENKGKFLKNNSFWKKEKVLETFYFNDIRTNTFEGKLKKTIAKIRAS
jgi:hypothetical protein